MKGLFIPLSKDIANRISEMILLEKKYLPNSKLPNEHELAEMLGVSRTSIREAIKILTASNIIIVKRGRGTFVTASPGYANDPLGLSLLDDKRKLVRHWFEMRLFIEPQSVRLAVQRATEDEIDEIESFERQEADLIKNGVDFIVPDQKFHAAIAKATHNDVIERLIPAIQYSVAEAVSAAKYGQSLHLANENAIRYHREIVKYLRARDGDGASIAMMYHIKRGLSDLDLT